MSLERTNTDLSGATLPDLVAEMLRRLGEDPDREGLARTPERVDRSLQWLTRGYGMSVAEVVGEGIFHEDHHNMVIVKDIEMYSLCEHHMLPFFGAAHVAYIPDGKVIGLSKIPRIVEMFARRLQVQERMTSDIARFLAGVLNPKGVAVLVQGQHMCSMMRGVKKSQASMTTSAFLGDFKSERELREDFMAQLALGRENR